MKRKILSVLFVSFSILGIIVYNFHAEAQKTGGVALKGQVADASGQAIAKASVYLIPASDIEAMAKTKIEIKRDSKNDEPLEDSLAANRDKYTKAITDAKGNFTIAKIADGKYFVYAEPSDKNYLPGGDKSNKSMDASELRGKTIKILISGNPPSNAAYVGSSKCLLCHKAYETEKKTLHKLGIRAAGKDGKNYWMNDITSHIFDVPRKDNIGVKGVEPGKAMPIPYTNKCGMCHKAYGL